MSTVSEALHSYSQMQGGLVQGLKTLSENQEIIFTLYKKLILPLDGMVFWVRHDLLSPSALMNSSAFNSYTSDQAQKIETPAKTLCIQGSLHYSTKTSQEEDETISINEVIFTTPCDINELNRIDPSCLWIGQFKHIRFSFSSHALFYKNAGLYHYRGHALYTTLENQIIDFPHQLNTRELIVSNSLPFWLSINTANPIYPFPANSYIPIYPSGLVPDNIRPPFASVHIVPEATWAIQAIPYIDRNSNHYQLASDKVRITLYGLNNHQILLFQDYLDFIFENLDTVGLMNTPIVRDDKKIQKEMFILSQKKTIEYQVSYNQIGINNIARQLILSCIPSFFVEDYNAVVANLTGE